MEWGQVHCCLCRKSFGCSCQNHPDLRRIRGTGRSCVLVICREFLERSGDCSLPISGLYSLGGPLSSDVKSYQLQAFQPERHRLLIKLLVCQSGPHWTQSALNYLAYCRTVFLEASPQCLPKRYNSLATFFSLPKAQLTRMLRGLPYSMPSFWSRV